MKTKLTKKQKRILELKKQKRIRTFHRLTDYVVGIVIGMLLTLFIINTYVTYLVPFSDLSLFLYSTFILVTNSLTYYLSQRKK